LPDRDVAIAYRTDRPYRTVKHRSQCSHAKGIDPLNAPVVVADTLSKYFGGYHAVDGVSLSIPSGTIYGVLGPNGAGKTTTLRMLLGIIDPDSGSRSLLGTANPRSVAHRVGYLPEERGLYPSMTARDSVAFMGALRGLPFAEGRIRADARLTDLGLGHAVKQKVRKLSKGMSQMVQLVGALVHDPELIVLDEPFSGLDPVNQERLENLILAQRDRGATIILSTHVMGHAQRLCDRLAIIAGGQRRFEGTVEDARGLLPLGVRYRPRDGVDTAALTRLLPAGANEIDGEWRFSVADDGVEAMLAGLVAAHHGVEGLSIERPGLHEAFVKIVGDSADARNTPGESA
jgi:ABC-2 type transport system ATP-binding protein